MTTPHVMCPYCNNYAGLVTGKFIYPHRRDLWKLNFWRCHDCDAYVGCHKGTQRPLGRLANPELRHWKKRAHDEFDKLWKSNGGISRSDAYRRMQEIMGMTADEAHIGEFTVEQCQRLVETLRGKLKVGS